MRKPSPTLTPQELEIMKVVWSRGHATVREVHDVLARERKIAYTTVMTMMSVLEKKGHLKRRTVGRSFDYRPAKPERVVLAARVWECVARVCGGSAEPLLAHLVEEEKLTVGELDALARRIEEKR
jgi:BlaI family penicillinase repressor